MNRALAAPSHNPHRVLNVGRAFMEPVPAVVSR